MEFVQRDVDRIAEILASAGRAEVMPRFKARGDGAVRLKTSVFDPVTEADVAAEKAITAALLEAWPNATIVGEEATSADPSLLDGLADAKLAFVVDPIDGTRNFVAGLPLFGVMASAVMAGEVMAGVIHDPVIGDTVYALRGQGAWISRPGLPPRRLQVAEARPLDRMEAMASSQFLPEPLKSHVLSRLPRLGSVASLRCAAHEYRTLATGFCHIAMYWKLMPWDHAAGWLIHREAGGYSAHFDGTEYRPAHTTGGLLLTPDQDSWMAVRDGLLV
jgi:fructose-1,6-bisphosphatase/inositol monophosphatase family enzyme